MDILLIALAVLAGLVVALKRIAPLTKTKADDNALAVVEPLAKGAESLLKK
jgi:hypothetical protein